MTPMFVARAPRVGMAGLYLLILAGLSGCQRPAEADACDPFDTASSASTLAPIMSTGRRSTVPEDAPAPVAVQSGILRMPVERMARL
ncbi:MAG TPA: hypothetical protein VGI11_05555 [Variovorax sp.]